MTTDRQGAANYEGDIGPAKTNTWQSGARGGIIVALLSGILVFLILQQIHPVFQPPEGAENAFGILPAEVQADLDKKNAIFVVSLLGGLIAAGVAVAEGLARKSIATALVAGLGCAAVGAVIGALAGYLGNMFFAHYKTEQTVTDLGVAVRVYGAMFALMGGGIGLAAGVFLGRPLSTAVNCLAGGLLAGLLSGLAYPVLCALAVPTADTNVLIPVGGGERFLWCGITAAIIGGLIPALAGGSKKSKAES